MEDLIFAVKLLSILAIPIVAVFATQTPRRRRPVSPPPTEEIYTLEQLLSK